MVAEKTEEASHVFVWTGLSLFMLTPSFSISFLFVSFSCNWIQLKTKGDWYRVFIKGDEVSKFTSLTIQTSLCLPHCLSAYQAVKRNSLDRSAIVSCSSHHYFLLLTFVTREDYSQKKSLPNFLGANPQYFPFPLFNYIRSVVWVSRPHCLPPKLFSEYPNAPSLHTSPNHLLRVFRQAVF